MPSPNIWGPPIWQLFHALAASIDENAYNALFPQLFNFIKRICAYLPCPSCSAHATTFLAKLSREHLANKEKFINTFYLFHNVVNVRKNKPLYNYSNMEKYKYVPINVAFNNFVKVYNTNGNMKLLTESFRRQMIVKEFRQWLLKNIQFFKFQKT